MKICITSSGSNLESRIDPRFGRCSYFIVWDYANDTFEAIANPNVEAGSGAGIQSAQLVVARQVAMVITGEVGPKAEQVLQAAKLDIITGETGMVKDVIEKYRVSNNDSGSYTQDSTPETTNISGGVVRRFFRRCFGLGNRQGGFGRSGGRGMRRGGRIGNGKCNSSM